MLDAIGETGERRSQPCVRVGAGELAVLDKRDDQRPIVAALVGPGKQGILTVERERVDGALECHWPQSAQNEHGCLCL